jgi:hypothetical protein
MFQKSEGSQTRQSGRSETHVIFSVQTVLPLRFRERTDRDGMSGMIADPQLSDVETHVPHATLLSDVRISNATVAKDSIISALSADCCAGTPCEFLYVNKTR